MINRDEIDPQGAVIRQTAEAAVAISEELTDLNPNIEIDAKEFGEHVKNGGWRLGLLVARSIERNVGDGVTGVKNFTPTGKISGRAFARQAGNISTPTVLKYLDAWNMAAADGLVPPSSNLSPGQGHIFDAEVHKDSEWKKYFSPPSSDEKNPLVSLYNKLNGALDLDAINADNFNVQSDFTVPQGYKASVQLERSAKEAQARWIALAKNLNIEIRDGEED